MHKSAKVWPLLLRGKFDQAKLMYRFSRRQKCKGNVDLGEGVMVTTHSQSAFPLELRNPKSERFIRLVCYQGPRLWSMVTVEKKTLPYDKFCIEIRKDLQTEMDNLIHI